MNSFAAAALSCRVLALYILIGFLSNAAWLPLTLLSVSHSGSYQHGILGNGILEPSYVRWPTILSTLIPFLLQIAFAVFLWIKAGWLARQMTAAVPGDETAPVMSGNLQRILLTMIGVFVLVTAIPDAGRALVTAVLPPESSQYAGSIQPSGTAEHWALLLRFGLGFGLLFGGSTLSRRLDNWRSL